MYWFFFHLLLSANNSRRRSTFFCFFCACLWFHSFIGVNCCVWVGWRRRRNLFSLSNDRVWSSVQKPLSTHPDVHRRRLPSSCVFLGTLMVLIAGVNRKSLICFGLSGLSIGRLKHFLSEEQKQRLRFEVCAVVFLYSILILQRLLDYY